MVKCIGGPDREGSMSILGGVSPQDGDIFLSHDGGFCRYDNKTK